MGICFMWRTVVSTRSGVSKLLKYGLLYSAAGIPVIQDVLKEVSSVFLL